jgi:hypothetical protein
MKIDSNIEILILGNCIGDLSTAAKLGSGTGLLLVVLLFGIAASMDEVDRRQIQE